MSSCAEKCLQSAVQLVFGNFEKYVKVHTHQHAILRGLIEHGYAGIGDCSVVSIKRDKMDSVKTQIMS